MTGQLCQFVHRTGVACYLPQGHRGHHVIILTTSAQLTSGGTVQPTPTQEVRPDP